MSVCETIITNCEQRCVQSQCMCTTRSSEFRASTSSLVVLGELHVVRVVPVFVCDAVVDLTLRSHSCKTVAIVFM